MAKAPKEEIQEKNPQETPPKKPAPIKVLILGFACLVALGALGGGAYYYFVAQGATAKKATPVPQIGTVWPMDAFIINIQDTNSERYLKIVVQLEVDDAQGTKELDMLKPKLRDNILDLLSAKTYRELIDLAGKQRLREEIALRLNSFLTSTKITRVYFTEFVIQ